MNTNRRDFLLRSGALTSAGLVHSAWRQSAWPASPARPPRRSAPSDYKALVCVFLFGGVDGNNLVVPLDPAGYALYSAVRTASSGHQPDRSRNCSRSSRRAAPPPTACIRGSPRSIRSSRRRSSRSSRTWARLNQPTTKANYLAVRPQNLFSHSDQQTQWQSSVSTGVSRSGWGGRLADRLAAANAASGFPVMTTIAGTNLFITGDSATPLALPSTGGLSLQGFNSTAAANARLAAMQALQAADGDNAYVKGAGEVMTRALALSGTVNPILTGTGSQVQVLFQGQNSSIAQQLLQVAKLIEARAQTGARRQVFFVSLGGFDTHSNELQTLATLLGQLAPALKSFYDATTLLGVQDQVTTFTLSDFGRTFQPASGAGTDHAWGNNHFILGGAVQGGSLYGRYPVLQRAGPDDADTAGRWIPTTSVEQYGATLARWFGASESDLAAIFPNLARFPAANLGFLA